MVYKDYMLYGNGDANNTAITGAHSDDANLTLQSKSMCPTKWMNNQIQKLGNTCKVLDILANAFFVLTETDHSRYDYPLMLQNVNNIITKTELALSNVNVLTNTFKKSYSNLKRSKTEANDPNKVGDCNEKFEVGIKSIREYLSRPQYRLMLDNTILNVKQKFLDDFNLKYPAKKMDMLQFESSGQMDSNGFKVALNHEMMNNGLLPLIMHKYPLGMYANGNTKIVHNLADILSKIKTDTNSNNLADFDCMAFGEDEDHITSLESSLLDTLDNLKRGLFVRSVVGGESSDRQDDSQNKIPNVVQSTDNVDVVTNLTQRVYALRRLAIQFAAAKYKCELEKNKLVDSLDIESSMRACFDSLIKILLEAKENFEMTVYFTKNDKIYNQILLRKIKDSPSFASSIQVYIPTINYLMSVLNKLFDNNDDTVAPKNIGDDVYADVCLNRSNNKYLNVFEESSSIRFAILLLDCINSLVIKPYNNRTGTNVTIFCIINDYIDSVNDKVIYKRVLQDNISMLETIHPSDCQSNSSTTVINNTPTVTTIKTFKFPFTYIFDKCELEKIPYYVDIAAKLKNRQNSLLITFGYSGVGKSVSLFGKTIQDNGNILIIPGLLQYFLQSIKSSFSVEVLEVYGRAFPAYESFNSDGDPNEGYMKSISWIKQYTKDDSVRTTGKYSVDSNDAYDTSKYEFTTTGKPGALISSPEEIKKYFLSRMSDDFVENSMYHVSEENAIAYIDNFSQYLVDPVELKRRQLRTIFFTPNNPDSSRSTLIYTLCFKVEKRNVFLTLIDFPGKENPVQSYVADIARDNSLFKSVIDKNYNKMYSDAYVTTMLTRFTDANKSINTVLNLLPYIPLILLSLDYNMNISIINNINDYIKSKNLPLDYMKSLVSAVLNETIIEVNNSSVKIRDYINFTITGPDTFSNEDGLFKQLYDGNNNINNLIEKTVEDNLVKSKDILNSPIYKAAGASNSLANNTGKGSSPNLLRMVYIVTIFQHMLKSKYFSNNDILNLLLNTMNQSMSSASGGINEFLKMDKSHFMDRMNNIFEAYFINETIALIIRDITKLSSDTPRDELLKSKFQGDKLKLLTMTNYLINRLTTNPSEYNSLIENPDSTSNRIYQIKGFTSDVYDDEKAAKMRKETASLYDYSKIISEQTKNNVLDMLNIIPKKGNEKLSIYILYLVSNVGADMKCQGSNTLLFSFKDILDCLVENKCGKP